MGDFFLTLPSNSSMTQYPTNHAGQYYTKLPQAIDLSGKDYEVGLAEIQLPNFYKNIPEEKAWIFWRSHPEDAHQYLFLQEGRYDTGERLVAALNAVIGNYNAHKKRETKPKFFYNHASKKVTLKLRRSNQFIMISPLLADLMHLPGRLLQGPLDMEGGGVLDLHSDTQTMYVYCDLVAHRQVGDTMVPLLRIVPATDKSKNVVYHIFEKPHYQPLARHQFNTIEILLSADTGETMSFEGGKTVVTLHLRPRRHK